MLVNSLDNDPFFITKADYREVLGLICRGTENGTIGWTASSSEGVETTLGSPGEPVEFNLCLAPCRQPDSDGELVYLLIFVHMPETVSPLKPGWPTPEENRILESLYELVLSGLAGLELPALSADEEFSGLKLDEVVLESSLHQAFQPFWDLTKNGMPKKEAWTAFASILPPMSNATRALYEVRMASLSPFDLLKTLRSWVEN